jgi:mevalonate kinase
MNENHRLLQQIEVSCKELDYLVDLARKQGAFGAKMTGGGGGGCMLALTQGKELQEKVALAMENEGFEVLRTKIGVRKA